MACKNIRKCFESIEKQGERYDTCQRATCFQQYDARKSIVIEENKKRYELSNAGHNVAVFHVDGGMISSKEIIKCDNLVLDTSERNAIFIELKGTDLKHALKQLENTVGLLDDKLPGYHLYGRAITSNRTNVPNMKTSPQYVKMQKFFRGKQGNLVVKVNKLCEGVSNLEN